jgi:hypothetical protein
MTPMTGIISKPIRKSKRSQRIFLRNRWDDVFEIRDSRSRVGLMDDFNRLMANLTEGEAIALMHKAFDLGVILFDAANTDAYNTSRL